MAVKRKKNALVVILNDAHSRRSCYLRFKEVTLSFVSLFAFVPVRGWARYKEEAIQLTSLQISTSNFVDGQERHEYAQCNGFITAMALLNGVSWSSVEKNVIQYSIPPPASSSSPSFLVKNSNTPFFITIFQFQRFSRLTPSVRLLSHTARARST